MTNGGVTNGDENARKAQEDAEFDRIVAGFGQAPEFPELVEPEPEPEPESLLPAELAESPWIDDEHFVPPDPPPVPRPRGPRALAWLGLVATPLIGLLLLVTHLSLPLVPFLLIGAFVGSFGYLVGTMGDGPADSGWDDGAVL